MAKSIRAFQAALLIGWMALGAAGLLYARGKAIPIAAAVPVIASLLIAYPFYLVTGFPDLREFLAGERRLPVYALAVSVAPYLACCCGAIPFQWIGLVRLAAMALALSLWYVVLPIHPITDLAFLAVTAAILLGHYFDPIYPALYKVPLVIVGHVSLYVVAILVLMLERRVAETGYGFLPRAREWRIGAQHAIYCVLIGLPLALVMRATHVVLGRPLWVIVATFFAFFWFASLTEEFFFRGVLQGWFEDWTRSPLAGLLITSAVFGLIHYWFRGWAWVPLGAIIGFFCGRARNRSGGIRASVVTHALVVALWRGFFA